MHGFVLKERATPEPCDLAQADQGGGCCLSSITACALSAQMAEVLHLLGAVQAVAFKIASSDTRF